MLVLTRYPGQSIKIGKDITITVLGKNHNCIRLGLDAPKNINILREELIPLVDETNETIMKEGNL